MKWQILNTANLPLGERVLRRGMYGSDVRELQALLAEGGFYFEVPDGEFGILTQEAVRLFQKTFRLKTDGIAGPAFCRALRRMASRTGRIVYTVKKGERLEKLSREFGVLPSAWQSIPQRSSIKRIYPGMKLLLYEKALIIWERKPEKMNFQKKPTGRIWARLRINSEGELQLPQEGLKSDFLHLVKVDPEVWETVFTSRKFSQKLVENMKKIVCSKWGLDLRSAPLEGYSNWGGFFNAIVKAGQLKQIPFVVLPLFLDAKGVAPVFWRNFELVERYAGLLLVEPLYDSDSVEAFTAAGTHFKAVMVKFAGMEAARRIIPVVGSRGWNWDANREFRTVTFKEIKLIRAMHARIVAETLPDGLSLIRYMSQGKQQCLAYRDLSAWEELLSGIVKYNFGGVVIRDFNDLGKAGTELVAGSFAVQRELQI